MSDEERTYANQVMQQVTPARPNHYRGCVYRYGANPPSGVFNCVCPGRNDPGYAGPEPTCEHCDEPAMLPAPIQKLRCAASWAQFDAWAAGEEYTGPKCKGNEHG